MKLTAIRVVEQLEVTSILCNKCGKEMLTESSRDGNGVHVGYDGGFDSKHFGDGVSVDFDLCEECLFNLCREFKHPPNSAEVGLDPK
jgi:hypothetical protein